MSLDHYVYNKFFNQYNSGVMVEVGSAGPDFLSQSKYFRNMGWRCICIEPNPKFVEMHKHIGNEIYQYACSNLDKDDIDFELVNVNNGNISNESFSALSVLEDVVKISGYSDKEYFDIEKIKVNVRKLDTILKESGLSHVDYVTIDVEGWELTVMEGFSTEIYKPKVIVLENNLPSEYEEYNKYMESKGYSFDSISETNFVYVNTTY